MSILTNLLVFNVFGLTADLYTNIEFLFFYSILFLFAICGLIGSFVHIKGLISDNQNRFKNNNNSKQNEQQEKINIGEDQITTNSTVLQKDDANEAMAIDNSQQQQQLKKDISFQVKKQQYQSKEDEELDIYEQKRQLQKSLFFAQIHQIKQVIQKKFIQCFAITKNVADTLLGTIYPSNNENDILGIFDGIKSIFVFFVIIFNVRLTAENQIEINEFVSLGKLIDGFLFSSGFLNCYQLYHKWERIRTQRQQKSQVNENGCGWFFIAYIKMILLRFLRLYPLLWATLMIQSTVKNEIYEQDFGMKERQNVSCVKNFLLIEPGHCALWTWYVSLDLFIYIFMPLLTFIGNKNTKRGIFLVLTISFLLLVLDFFHMEEPKNELYSLYNHQGFQYEHTKIDVNISLRICKYSIGVVSALLWIQYIKKYQKQLLILLAGAGGQIFSLIMYYAGYKLIMFGSYQSREYVHMHWILANLNRHSFVLGFIFTILPGLLGIQDYLSSLLKLKVFQVLGRLTYGIYLTHLFVIWAYRDIYIAHLKQNEWLFTKSFVIGVDLYLKAILIAFYLYIMLERPVTRLAKACIKL